jgi:hypothetical protein
VSGPGGRELAAWLLPLGRGAVERAAEGLAQPTRVSHRDALSAATCPAAHRERLVADGPWTGWTPRLAARSVARRALRAHIDADRAPSTGVSQPDPLALVRDAIRAARTAPLRAVEEWLADDATSDDERRITAALATQWLSSFLRMAGWPLPPHTNLDDVRPWTHADVTVAPGTDAVVGRVTATGGHEGWALVGSSGRGPAVLHDRACVDAVALTASRGIAPARVVVLCADAGQRVEVDVDPDALRRGVDLIAGAVRQRVLAQARGYDESDATPGAHCRFCELVATCGPAAAWLAGPGRGQGGLPVIDPD